MGFRKAQNDHQIRQYLQAIETSKAVTLTSSYQGLHLRYGTYIYKPKPKPKPKLRTKPNDKCLLHIFHHYIPSKRF